MSNRSKSKISTAQQVFLIIKLLILIIIFAAVIIGGWHARRLFPYPAILARFGIDNWQVRGFHDYFELDPSQVTVVKNDTRLQYLDNPPVFINNELHFHYTFLRDFIDPFVFWDSRAQTLFFSTDNEITRFPNQFVPFDFVYQFYSSLFFNITFHEQNNIIVIENIFSDRFVTAARRAAVRHRPDNAAYIKTWVDEDDMVTGFGRYNGFYRVRTGEGLLGYISIRDAIEGRSTVPSPDVTLGRYLTHPSPRIVMTWEMITAPAGNYTAMQNPLPEELTVISPTWFSLDPYAPDGTLISFVCRDYIEWAHGQNTEVWAKAFDTNHDISGAVLRNYRAREHVVSQLADFADYYGLDGININFEHVRAVYGRYYVQFLRELAVEMRRRGVVLSVATYVPAPWFSHYYHHLVGHTVDFVAIMTYNEHYAGSPEPGPVASIPFVRHWTAASLELIPREKLILGLPFYNRMWRVAPGGSHTSSLYGMTRPWTLLEEHNVSPVWDAVAGSYYANFFSGRYNYRIWIECERSIEEKMRVFTEFDLAGVAGWRRGLETQGVWGVIGQTASQQGQAGLFLIPY